MNLKHIIDNAIHQPPLPLSIATQHAQQLHCTELLRLLPGKRAVFKAFYNDQTVIAKIFSPRAQRQCLRELQAYQYLSNSTDNHTLHTPKRLDVLQLTGDEPYIAIIYQHIDASTLGQLWRQSFSLDSPQQCRTARQKIITSAYQTIANMHNAGLWQQDLHLDNFLLQHDLGNGQEINPATVYIIDVGSIDRHRSWLQQRLNTLHFFRQQYPEDLLRYAANESVNDYYCSLPQHKRLDNLALFIAQFNISEQHQLLSTLDVYLNASKQLPISGNTVSLQHRIKGLLDKRLNKRIQHFAKKIKRNSTAVYKEKSFKHLLLQRREFDSAALKDIFYTPALLREQAVCIKDGNSSSVFAYQLKDTPVVVKRYQYKDFGRLLRRCWRKSRAMRSWEFAHHLEFYGIKTPQPIAVFEHRIGFLKFEAFYIAQLCQGTSLEDLIKEHGEFSAKELDHLTKIFLTFSQLKLVHGDFKASNLIKHQNDIYLIDLDAMHYIKHNILWSMNKHKDFDRLKKNWAEQPNVIAQLNTMLKNIYLTQQK